MKTAREIIAVTVDRTNGEWWADAIIAALAAEGFSIVETGRDPVTIEACAEIAEGGVVFGNQNEVYACGDMMDAWEMGADDAGSSVAKAIRSLSRSTREGKTE